MSGNSQAESLASMLSKKRKETEMIIVEYELNQVVDKKLKKLQQKETATPTMYSPEKVEERDEIFVTDLECSIGSHIKNKALELYQNFKLHDTNEQTITSLGLNSILDLSFNFPEGQSTLFSVGQWGHLQQKFASKKYQVNQFDHIKEKLKPLLTKYRDRKSWVYNWSKLYRETKSLQSRYDVEEDDEWEEEDFCLFFIESILKLQKYHDYLFDDNFDKSEWDYICKLWSPIMERLFVRSGLRLKWGDTKLSLDDISCKNNLKVDLRIMQDENVQRQNQETDTSVLEASKGNPSVQKLQSDHCKLMVECKSIIDMYLSKGFDVDNVDSIQICGPDIMISNLCLSAPGLYTANELFHGSVTNSLSQIEKMLDIALNLLAFKDVVIKIKSNYQEEKATIRQDIKTMKSRKYNRASENLPKKVLKKNWIRGTWIAFRDMKSKLPLPPPNLV